MLITVNYNEKSGKTVSDEQCDRYYSIILATATVHRKKSLTLSLASSIAFKNLVSESAQCKTHKWVFLYKGMKLRVDKGFILNPPVKYLNMPRPDQKMGGVKKISNKSAWGNVAVLEPNLLNIFNDHPPAGAVVAAIPAGFAQMDPI